MSEDTRLRDEATNLYRWLDTALIPFLSAHGHDTATAELFLRRLKPLVGGTPMTDPHTAASFPEAWRCRTCRWWTKPACQDCVGDFPGFGQCMAANPGLAQVTHDGELLTAPDFACIEWEAKGD